MIKVGKSLVGMTFIDLFAGLGGFRLAFESFGCKCVFSSEWDSHAQEVYKANFNEVPNGDITQIDEKTIPDHDILCAGFPCQPFSISGNKRGFEDYRGTLFFDVARIASEKKPKIVFLENVKHFATHNDGETLKVVESTMSDLGYSFHPKVLNAVDYGIPQKRERLYIVCFRNDLDITDFKFPKAIPLIHHVEDFLLADDSEIERLYVNREDTCYNDTIDNSHDKKPIRLGIVNKGGQGERIYSTKGIAITLSAEGGGAFAKTGGYLINGRPRKLHPRECARLMGYPDSFKIAKKSNQAYKQFGNSVVVDVLQYIIINIAEAMSNTSSKEELFHSEEDIISRMAS